MNSSVIAFLASNALSIFGSAVSAVAVPWMLLGLNVTPQQMGWLLAIVSVVGAPLALLGSPLLAKCDERRFCIASDLLEGTALFALAVVHAMGHATVALVVLIMLLNRIVGGLSSGASGSITRDLSARSGVPAQRINGFIGTFHNFGDMVGPSVGGLVVLYAGVAWALVADGLSFLVSAFLLWAFVPRPVAQPTRTASREPLRTQFFGGLVAIARDPLLRCVTLVSAMINISVTSLLVYLLPVTIKESAGTALNVGVVMSFFGTGALAASVTYTWKGGRVSPLFSTLGSMLVVTCTIAAMAVTSIQQLWILFFIVGACVGYLGPLELTLVQEASPRANVSRIVLAYSTARTLLVPVGFIVVSSALEAGGVPLGFLAVAAPLVLPCMLLIYHALTQTRLWQKPYVSAERSPG